VTTPSRLVTVVPEVSDLDRSLSGDHAGLPPLADHDDAHFQDALATVVDACNRHGVVPGVHATPALASRRAQQGFRMITVGFDHMPVMTALRADLAEARAAVGG